MPNGFHHHGYRKYEKVEMKDAKKIIKLFIRYIKPYKFLFLLVFFLVLLTSSVEIISPYLIGKAIDSYIMPKNFNGFLNFIIICLTIYGLNSAISFFHGFFMLKTSQSIVYSIRKDLFSKIQTIPLEVIDTRPHGDIVSRITNDVDSISNILSNSIIHILMSLFIFCGIFIVMLRINVILTLVILIFIPFTLFTTRIIGRKARNYFYQNQILLGKINSVIEEDIPGLEVIKAFNREEKEIEKFSDFNNDFKKIGIKAQIYAGIVGPFMNFINNINLVIIGGIGGYFAIKNLITIGSIAVFITYARQFSRPLNSLAEEFNQIQIALASGTRVKEILETEEEIEDGEIELPNVKGEIEFKNVYFSYVKDILVLKNVNFHINPGEVAALVGPTGAGKTTIVNLLARFYEVDKGQILLDGIDIRKIKKSCLRNMLAVVLQDAYIFSETIKENIRYGKPTANDEEIENAAKISNAEKFILSLPSGYETIISEERSLLSQGQRQLLAIARTILSEPKILILDEAMSNVDPTTEKYVQRAITNLIKGKTCIIIAHRLSTIKNADIIIVVENGQVVEQGTHKELIEKKGYYYSLTAGVI
ncbi:MAG TPA: ABC transporter ATP-binding protein [Candidatus Ratteibacteria bacterium]|nr:ABC transporter ATP-binding protein [Candidatus Ratteibacteria bacterium]